MPRFYKPARSNKSLVVKNQDQHPSFTMKMVVGLLGVVSSANAQNIQPIAPLYGWDCSIVAAYGCQNQFTLEATYLNSTLTNSTEPYQPIVFSEVVIDLSAKNFPPAVNMNGKSVQLFSINQNVDLNYVQTNGDPIVTYACNSSYMLTAQFYIMKSSTLPVASNQSQLMVMAALRDVLSNPKCNLREVPVSVPVTDPRPDMLYAILGFTGVGCVCLSTVVACVYACVKGVTCCKETHERMVKQQNQQANYGSMGV